MIFSDLTSHCEVTGIMHRIGGIIPKWPQVSVFFRLVNYCDCDSARCDINQDIFVIDNQL